MAKDDRQHHIFMSQALDLARRGLYTTTPNPRVGCLVVDLSGEIVGQGWHHMAGQAHAEVQALQQAGPKARGATVYVTLEPCAHIGRTLPCTEALISAGVSRVFVAIKDFNPLVSGQGIRVLHDAGIEVLVGCQRRPAFDLNRGFFQRMVRQRPWIRSKIAASLDGKIALQNGKSQWISSLAARRDGHHWRACACAIISSAATVSRDKALLTVRHHPTSRQPTRFILDSNLSISPHLPIFDTLAQGPVYLVTKPQQPQKTAPFLAKGVRFHTCHSTQMPRIDLHALFKALGQASINEVLVEAGATLNGALVDAELIDELIFYSAPKILGEASMGAFCLPNTLTSLAQCAQLRFRQVQMLGPDVRTIATMHYPPKQSPKTEVKP